MLVSDPIASIAGMEQMTVRAADGVDLHVGVHGTGTDVVMLSGGPGCVQYLERDELVPDGCRAWFPEPRGVGRSAGGPHDMAQAVADLEDVRRAASVDRWLVLGHSWGCDLAVRYALDVPTAVSGVIGIAGHGPHKDRTWTQIYEQGKLTETPIEVEWDKGVWQSLSDSFVDWIHEPDLWRRLGDTPVPMIFIAAGADIRPNWPLRQLARLVPDGDFQVVDGVPHDFWATHPEAWLTAVRNAHQALQHR